MSKFVKLRGKNLKMKLVELHSANYYNVFYYVFSKKSFLNVLEMTFPLNVLF